MNEGRIFRLDHQVLWQSGVSLLSFLLILVCICISIYCLILFIKLARRGIVALDIYINMSKSGINGKIDKNQVEKIEK